MNLNNSLKNKPPGFLTDEEKLQHMMRRSGYDETHYSFNSFVKIYEGAEILIYHFDKNGVLHYDKVFNCTGFIITDSGMQASLIDRLTFRLFTVKDVPEKLFDVDVLAGMPVRCVVERTMKITRNGTLIEGMSTALLAYTKSDPNHRIPHHHYAINLTRAHKTFHKHEIRQAERRAANGGIDG